MDYSDASNMMYQSKYNDDWKPEAFKLWNVSVSAKPKSNVTMSHTWTKQQEWAVKNNDKGEQVSADYKVSEKTASKLGFKHDDVKFDVAVANDKWSVKASGNLVNDDWKVDGSAMYEDKPGAQWKAEFATAVASPDMSGVKMNMNMSVEQVSKLSTKDGKAEWTNQNPTLKMSTNVNFEKDYHLGAAVEHDTKDLKKCDVGLMKKEDGNKYWIGYNVKSPLVRVGCAVHYADKNFTHVYEARYDHANKADKQFMSQPIRVAAGGQYVLSDASTMVYGMEMGKASNWQMKWAHKLDKNWKVSINQHFDCNRLESKQNNYDLGFDIAYTL